MEWQLWVCYLVGRKQTNKNAHVENQRKSQEIVKSNNTTRSCCCAVLNGIDEVWPYYVIQNESTHLLSK